MTEIVSVENPARCNPTLLIIFTPPLRPSAIMKGGMSFEKTEPPEMIANRPTRQNWWMPTRPEIRTLSKISQYPAVPA